MRKLPPLILGSISVFVCCAARVQMPAKEQLGADVIADFERWVTMGAPWPGENVAKVAGATTQATGAGIAANYDHLRKELWSWQPVGNPAAPEVRNAGWVKDDID